jgi:5-methylcytosine-specific restriction endonuclease McrA
VAIANAPVVEVRRSGRAPSIPCASCGALVWWNRDVVLGQTRCRPCRTAGAEPSGIVYVWADGRDPAANASPRGASCSSCGCRMWWHASYVAGVSRCQPCRRLASAQRPARPPRRRQDRVTRRAKDRLRCARRRARQAAQLVEAVDPDVVFARDGWRCHLCRRPIDRRLSGHDPMGPTIDHLVPLSAGGEHSYANVAAAHRRCNTRRGTRGAAQLALIG